MEYGFQTYLTFKIGESLFGVTVDKVLEISEYKAPQPIPESINYLLGITEFREEIIPIIDSGLKLNFNRTDINALSCIIVLELYNSELSKKYHLGIIVDSVTDVIEVPLDEIKNIENDFKPGYILASVKSSQGWVYIMNSDKIFNEKEVIAIDKVLKTIK